MKFDKQFVHCVYDEELTGKLCVFADDIPALREHVEQHDCDYTGVLQVLSLKPGQSMDDLMYPFCLSNKACYRFVYYDPNYVAKVAYSQGKQIQYRTFQGEWVDVVDKPLWCVRDVYRVKPEWYVHPFIDKNGNCIGHPYYKDASNKTFVSFEGTEAECDAWIAEHTPKTRRMTNRELAKWLAEGNGQAKYIYLDEPSIITDYRYEQDSSPVGEGMTIREWDSDEWHEPLVEVKE